MKVLTYHEVTNDPHSAYEVRVDQLREHLEWIAHRKRATPATAPVITFDDGEQSQYEHALPLLEKLGIKAIFFVSVGLVGKTATVRNWHQRFMDWPQLQDLLQLGHRVQSHGWSHKFLTLCSTAELKQEIELSRQTLQDRLGAEVDSMSFPGGRWNACISRICADAGYKRVFTSDPWVSRRERDGLTVHGRFMIWRSTDTKCLEAMLSANQFELLRLQMQGRFKLAARRLLGENVYHDIWKRITGRKFKEGTEGL